ncbi:hypothetical protein BJY52DRAFT_1265618 [Lactarius psammicola]|nr:hypothetical protein BJY52DRAFT_1265618 [Lactarius psammicola]
MGPCDHLRSHLGHGQSAVLLWCALTTLSPRCPAKPMVDRLDPKTASKRHAELVPESLREGNPSEDYVSKRETPPGYSVPHLSPGKIAENSLRGSIMAQPRMGTQYDSFRLAQSVHTGTAASTGAYSPPFHGGWASILRVSVVS